MAESSDMATKKVKRRHRTTDVDMASIIPAIDVPATSTAVQDSMKPKPWSWMPISSETFSNTAMVFSQDGMHFFVPSACSIKIYSTSTLKVVSTLSSIQAQSRPSTSSSTCPDHHTQLVTSVLLNPNNPLQLYSASIDGTIKIWDWIEGVLLKTVDFCLPIWHMCAHASFPDTVFLHADVSNTPERLMTREQGNVGILGVGMFIHPIDEPKLYKPDLLTYIVLFNASDTKASSRAFKVTFKPLASTVIQAAESISIGKPINRITALAVSPNGLWLVATSGMKAHIASTSRPKEGWSKFTSAHRLTCLAFHPTQGYFATGDEEGEVRLWYCLNDDQLSFEKLSAEKKAATSLFHWHAHAVQSLAFTPNGSYLLSGGLASVLVMWQIETGHKGFVPRIGAPINSISVVETLDRGQEFLLGLADGDLAMVSANTLNVRSRAGLKLRSARPSKYPPILAIHPQRNWLATTSSHPASLQIYDPYTSSLVSELEVAPSNRIAATDEDTILTPCTVVQAAFSSEDGRWLATVDVREATLDAGVAIVLKIWNWVTDGARGTYLLNTKIDRPHGKSIVNSIHFSSPDVNGDCTLATTGQDGLVRLWGVKRIAVDKENQTTEEIWVQCASIAYRSQVPCRVAFSLDASLIAVTYAHCVVLFNGSSHAFLQAITNVGSLSWLSSATFLGRVSRYLAICGVYGEDVLVWDLISSHVALYIDTVDSIEDRGDPQLQPPPRIIQRPDAAAFAVVCGKSTQIWDLLQLRPLSQITSLPLPIQQISTLRSSTVHQNYFSLAAIAEDGSLVLVGDTVSLPENEGAIEMAKTLTKSGATRLSLFEDVFGRSAFRDLEDQVKDPPRLDIDAADFGASIDLRLLDGPAYLLPPIETLFSSLMGGILKRSKGEAVNDNVAEEEVEIAMEVDEVDIAEDEQSEVISSRTLDKAEMDIFVQLFQEHCAVPGPSTSSNGHADWSSRPRSISIGKANSAPVNGHINGDHRHHSLQLPVSSDSHPSQKSPKAMLKSKAMNDLSTKAPAKPALNGGSSSDTPSPPPIVGQKRKASTRKEAKLSNSARGLT